MVFKSAAFWYSSIESEETASSFSSETFFNSFLISSSSNNALFFKLIFEHASSIKSMALSGKNLSWIYFSDIFTVFSIISLVIETLW